MALLWRGRRSATLIVTPAAGRLSARVGETIAFSADAPWASGFTWSLWGRAVAHQAGWSYTPAPEDAGWQQVVLIVGGPGGVRRVVTWDMGVEVAEPPALTDLVPPAGPLVLEAAAPARFRCEARARAARAGDRLHFEWTVDDRIALREDRLAADAISELALAPAEPGRHVVRVRVSEDERVASLAEWSVDVAAPPPVAVVSSTTLPPPVAALPSTTLPPPVVSRLVPMPGPRELDVALDAQIGFAIDVVPDDAEASYEWSVDGRPAQRGVKKTYEYRAEGSGRHRIAVVVTARGTRLGTDAWRVTVHGVAPGTEPTATMPSTTVPLAAEAAAALAPSPRPGDLPEDEVRRWLDEYARAWSRKDVAALRRMGQVRSAAEAERLERYFASIEGLRVDLRVVALHVEGTRAAVEFERTDTVIDPGGRRQQLRLPPLKKEIERTPEGLRFVE